ncbi:GGDEF domain-containing protein [Shewanella pneumatophori]|uniref:diguanylate cyclase n=1 Tax=Shewanella pneumatophori TaxID=314092 RepID=A0A9X2CDG3_9GAMM|nr:GGDEF domain-containing protein [Shewanella pneumatophori]MCL1137942.1 diguanylate cyclase [Shewanella pneumatophori]
MAKSFFVVKVLLISCLLLVSNLGFANSKNPLKADAIFTAIDNGIAINDHQQYLAYIDELDSLIAPNDAWRQLRKDRARCWSFDIYTEGEIDKALAFVEEALKNPLLAQYPSHQLDLAMCKAWYLEQNGEVEVALKSYNKAVNDAYKIEDLRLVADARSIRGYLHSYQGNFTQALEDLITAQSMYQNLNLPAWEELNLYEIANAYRRLGDQKSAIRYFKQLHQSKIASGNFDVANTISVSIAIAEEELGHLERAKARFNEAYLYWGKKGDQMGQATVGVNIAGTLIKLGEFEQAQQYLDSAAPHILASDEGFYAFLHLFQAQIYLAENQFDNALASVNEARDAFERVKNITGLAQLQQLKSEIFVKQLNWQQAYVALNEYVKLHNELDKKLLSSHTTEMRTRFNADQIEQENNHLIENQQLRDIELAMLEQNKLQQWIIIILGGLILLILSVFAYKQSQKNKLLSSLALTDDLTQLPNRRYIYDKAQLCLEQAIKAQVAFSVISFDADNFKAINDNFGHEVGDLALKLLAQICRNELSGDQEAARVGGEEFLIILPNTNKTQAYEIASTLVQKISNADFKSFPQGFKLTISAGVASLKSDNHKLSSLLKQADKALYQAKADGRNQAQMS